MQAVTHAFISGAIRLMADLRRVGIDRMGIVCKQISLTGINYSDHYLTEGFSKFSVNSVAAKIT